MTSPTSEVLMQKADSPSRASSSGWSTCLALALLMLAVGLSFSSIYSADFVSLDDWSYVVDNPHVTRGLSPSNVAWALTTRHGGFWIPLTWISFQLDATLSPSPMRTAVSDLSPMPSAVIYHVSNVLYHAVGTCLLYLFLRRATGRIHASFVAALLWAVHPLRVESVAWVTERKDCLSGMFGFLALYLYAGWTLDRSKSGYVGVCAAATASLMAKPMTLTLPCVMLLLDFWPLGRLTSVRQFWSRVYEKLPLLGICSLDGAATYLAQRRAGFLPLGPMDRVGNALAGYGHYLWREVDFRGLAPFYPYGPPPLWLTMASAVVLVAATFLAITRRKKQPALLVGWFWFLGAFVPLVGLFNSGSQACADRFTYFPTVGLAILMIYALPSAWLEGPRRALVLAGVCMAAVVLGAGTFQLTKFWHDGITLYEYARSVTPRNSTCERALANAYLVSGRFDDAIAVYQQLGDADVEGEPPESGIGTAYLLKHEPVKAIGWFRQALVKKENSLPVRLNLGVAFMRLHDWDRAVEQFAYVLDRDPSNEKARAALNHALQHRE